MHNVQGDGTFKLPKWLETFQAKYDQGYTFFSPHDVYLSREVLLKALDWPMVIALIEVKSFNEYIFLPNQKNVYSS